MRCYISVVCALSVLAAVSYAAPASLPQQGATLNEQANTLLSVDAGSDGSTSLSGRFKRNIQLLRQLCPQLFQVIDTVIQNVTSQIFRVVGRVVLQSGGLGGGGGGGGESQVSVVLPTFPPDEDDDEDEEEDEDDSNNTNNQVQTTTTKEPSFDIRTIGGNRKPLDSKEVALSINEIYEMPTENTLYTSPASASANTLRARRTIRAAEDDQEPAASGGNGPSPVDDLSNVDAEDADRDKRYLPFGGGDAHATGGGSGNFLFDIIRLIAGSGATEESDEKEQAPVGAGGVAELDVAKDADGYTEGIPGPITRLFVVANRGLANLIQDLILRLAQTSERIVNFKARLITALI